MKLALLGPGKTGGEVLELLSKRPTVFDSKDPPTYQNLQGHDVILSFLPGLAFASFIPLLLKMEIPVVTGSTGFDWPSHVRETLLKQSVAWVRGSNFALGMALAHLLIEDLGQVQDFPAFAHCKLAIHEIHHKNKRDAPSGTALSWRKWLGNRERERDVEITSERVGDVVGTHQVVLDAKSERLTLKHEALDRRVFAEGALWACSQVMQLPPGLHSFEHIARKELQKQKQKE